MIRVLRCVACSRDHDPTDVDRGERCECGGALVLVTSPVSLADRRPRG